MGTLSDWYAKKIGNKINDRSLLTHEAATVYEAVTKYEDKKKTMSHEEMFKMGYRLGRLAGTQVDTNGK